MLQRTSNRVRIIVTLPYQESQDVVLRHTGAWAFSWCNSVMALVESHKFTAAGEAGPGCKSLWGQDGAFAAESPSPCPHIAVTKFNMEQACGELPVGCRVGTVALFTLCVCCTSSSCPTSVPSPLIASFLVQRPATLGWCSSQHNQSPVWNGL